MVEIFFRIDAPKTFQLRTNGLITCLSMGKGTIYIKLFVPGGVIREQLIAKPSFKG